MDNSGYICEVRPKNKIIVKPIFGKISGKITNNRRYIVNMLFWDNVFQLNDSRE